MAGGRGRGRTSRRSLIMRLHCRCATRPVPGDGLEPSRRWVRASSSSPENPGVETEGIEFSFARRDSNPHRAGFKAAVSATWTTREITISRRLARRASELLVLVVERAGVKPATRCLQDSAPFRRPPRMKRASMLVRSDWCSAVELRACARRDSNPHLPVKSGVTEHVRLVRFVRARRVELRTNLV